MSTQSRVGLLMFIYGVTGGPPPSQTSDFLASIINLLLVVVGALMFIVGDLESGA